MEKWNEEIFDEESFIAWYLIQISITSNRSRLVLGSLRTNQPIDLGSFRAFNDLEASIFFKWCKSIWNICKDFDRLIGVIYNHCFKRAIVLDGLMQLFDIKLRHIRSEQFELLFEVISWNIKPWVKSGGSEADLLCKALQIVF